MIDVRSPIASRDPGGPTPGSSERTLLPLGRSLREVHGERDSGVGQSTASQRFRKGVSRSEWLVGSLTSRASCECRQSLESGGRAIGTRRWQNLNLAWQGREYPQPVVGGKSRCRASSSPFAEQTLDQFPRRRVRSEAAFASLAGVAPLEASSGQRSRHRLNRGGDRALNRALHTVAITRMRCHPETCAYEARRTLQGKTHRDIWRCLKRSISRRLYRIMESSAAADANLAAA